MKRSSPVYYSKNIEEIETYYLSKNIDYKIDSIEYLQLTDNLDLAFDKMKECYKLELKPKQKERLDFIQYIYWLKKDDEYKSQKLKRELKNSLIYSDNFIYEFCESATFEKQIQIFDDNFYNNKSIVNRYKNKIIRNDIKYLYFQNLNRITPAIKSRFIEKHILKDLNRILKKRTLNIYQTFHIWQILLLITNHYISLKIIKNEFFLECSLILKMKNKLIDSIKVYSEILTKKQKTDFNEVIVSIYKLLASNIKISELESIKIQEECIAFVDENSKFLGQNTIFLNALFKNKSMGKEAIVAQIKDILDDKNSGEILFLVMLGASTMKGTNELKDYIGELVKIQREKNKSNSNNMANLSYSIKILKFWSGEKMNLKELSENMYLDPYLKLCINYDNNEIDYKSFLSGMEDIKYISTSMIFDWTRLENIFKKTNSYDWLKQALSRIKQDELNDNSLKQYVASIYQKAYKEETALLLNAFRDVDAFVREKYNDIIYLYYAVSIYTGVYNYFDDIVKSLILKITENFDKLKENIKDDKFILEFAYQLVIFNFSVKDKDIKEALILLVETDDLLNNNAILLYGLTYNDEELLNKYYDLIFDDILEKYKESESVSRTDYAIIHQIAFNTMGNDNIKINLLKNKFFHEDSKLYILKDDYNEELKDLYKELKIEKIEVRNENMKEDNLLFLLTHRVFFKNIEKMNAGKIIRTPSNASGKELLETLAKEVGYDETKNEIDSIMGGKKVNQVWFNLFNMHSFLKCVYIMNNSMFLNSKNEMLKINKCLLHFSALILCVKIDIEDIIHNDKRIFITNSIYDDLMYQKTFDIHELTDGIIEPLVNYDELLDKTCDLVEKLNDSQRVVQISTANILGIKNQEFLNKYDRDIFKFIASNIDECNEYFILTEDPFYYSIDWFKERSFGLYSYIIEKYISGEIKSDRLLEITNKLKLYNYGFNVSKSLYRYLVEKADDENIEKIVDIIGEYIL